VELALDDGKFAGMYCHEDKFQSLFSWNLLLMALWTRQKPPKRVSILVFVELALDGWQVKHHNVVIVWFQSLFSWNLLLMLQRLEK